MDGKHPISSKHSKNTQPGVCVQCLRNNSCDIHLQWVFVSVCQLQHCGAETAPGWEQLQGDEKNSTISFWDLSVPFYFYFFFFWVHFAASVMAGVFLQIMCLEFWMEGSEWNMCQLQSRHSARETKSEETNWEAKKQKTELEVTRVVSGHLWSVDRWKYHERMRGGGNAVSWSKQPLSLIIITELQFDLEPHQDSGRSGSMESLTLRWINEGIIMRFCKTHSCVRGQKHPIVLQPWQENLAVNTLVLKLGL